MIKSIPWNFVKSTSTVFGLSIVAAFGVQALGGNFWASFCLFVTVQYILFSFAGTIIRNYFIQKTLQKELEALEPLSTILECAYCNTSNVMTFLPDQNERAEFDCTSCNKKNLVNIQFVVARITEPVNVNSSTGIPLTDIKDEKE